MYGVGSAGWGSAYAPHWQRGHVRSAHHGRWLIGVAGIYHSMHIK